MIPVPLSWAAAAGGLAIAGVVGLYEGLPLLFDGRVDRAFAQGQLIERQAWEELRRREQAAREVDRRAAQAKIDAAEADYWRRSEIQKTRILELENAIASEPEDSVAVATPDAGASGACPPAISRRLRDALDAIGR